MATSPYIIFSVKKLEPLANAKEARRLSVRLKPSTTFTKGEVLGEITASGLFAPYSGQTVANPVVAPTAVAGAATAGTMANGTWDVKYSYLTAGGETAPTAATTVTVSGGPKVIDVTGIVMPTNVLAVKWYVSDTVNGTATRLYLTNNGSGFSITAAPAGTQPAPLGASTAVAASDGTQAARAIMMFDCVTDASGNVFLGAQASSEHGTSRKSAEVYVTGWFATKELTRLDDTAVGNFGHLIEGTKFDGILTMVG